MIDHRDFRPFWRAHPLLCRIAGVLLAIFSPVAIPAVAIHCAWDEAKEFVCVWFSMCRAMVTIPAPGLMRRVVAWVVLTVCAAPLVLFVTLGARVIGLDHFWGSVIGYAVIVLYGCAICDDARQDEREKARARRADEHEAASVG